MRFFADLQGFAKVVRGFAKAIEDHIRAVIAALPPQCTDRDAPDVKGRTAFHASPSRSRNPSAHRRGLTQGQLSELADLSLKYVGEIERGEANTTLDVVERLADVLGWDPMAAFGGVREPITEGVRILLIAEHERIGARARMMTTWLEALDPALHDAARSARLRSLPDSPRGADDGGSVPRASRRRHRP